MEESIFEWLSWQRTHNESQILGFVKSSFTSSPRPEFAQKKQTTGCLKQRNIKTNHMKNMLRGYIADTSCRSSTLHLDSRSQALGGH